MIIFEQFLPLLNLLILPVLGWAIKVERRLMKIEMLLEKHSNGTTKSRMNDKE